MPRRRLVAAVCLLTSLAATSPGAHAEEGAFNPTYQLGSRSGKTDSADLPRVRIDLRAGPIEQRVDRLLAEMTLEEKVGQLVQSAAFGEDLPEDVAQEIREGRLGSLFYTGSIRQTREAKRIAAEESRLGIPLLTPRDVIHGFRTVFPIPIGQAAAWNPDLIEQASAVAAVEARQAGVNWTFAPMLDISRDPRWGRVAESLGEDPLLAAAIAEAMVRGFQSPDGPQSPNTGIAACGKHFVAYGLSEGGRDYNRAQVAISELHNVFLAPFRSAVRGGAATMMTSFNTINGVPGTGNRELVSGILKNRWGFDGLVVSDWGSVIELIEHGYAADDEEAARAALTAGVDMEMATPCYREHLAELVAAGRISEGLLDDAVRRVLRTKLRFALDSGEPVDEIPPPTDASRDLARRLARQSIVLLKNSDQTLPLDPSRLTRIAVLGPLAHAARDQLGCWMLDGKADEAVTVVTALRQELSERSEVKHLPVLESCLDLSRDRFDAAVAAARDADVAILCVGEGWNLSGEARSRADLDLPGAQPDLVAAITATGTPCVLVVISGRPLTIGPETEASDAVLVAWHPGTMGGPALADLLLGKESPSGKLPVTFPKAVGQAPLYYNAPSTGRPPLAGTRALIGSDLMDFPEEQKYRSHYLDVDPFPLRPFGFGLSYTRFKYGPVELSSSTISRGQALRVRVPLTNTGEIEAEEVSQLYVQDCVGEIVRPTRELKGFRRVRLAPGETVQLEFTLTSDDLGYYDNGGNFVVEPGRFRVAVGGDSAAPLDAEFLLKATDIAQADSPSAATPQR